MSIGDMASPEVVLTYQRVSKSFAGSEGKQALDQVSLSVQKGIITGLAGPDGAGKTTLIRLAAGLLKPDEGEVSVLGLDSLKDTLEIRGKIGYMPQQFGLYQDLTIEENLNLYADLQGMAVSARPSRFEQLLTMTGLTPFTKRLAGQLSGGMKQKLGLACSLIKSPELLLLDEPTVGVDPVSRRELWVIIDQLVTQDRIGILLATAYLDELDQCQEIVMLDQGRVIDSGPPASFQQKVSGQVFVLTPAEGINPRTLQSEVIQHPDVLDATIRSGKVRCVLREGKQAPIYADKIATWVQSVEAVEPNFEDAFMAMLSKETVSTSKQTLGAGSRTIPQRADSVSIEVKNLVKRFGDFTAVQNINFQVKRGEIFGLLGSNGAGKTTTFRMLCGLMQVSDGEVSVAGQDLRRASAKARSQIGYMAQLFSLYRQLTVLSNLQFYGKAYGLHGQRFKERIDWALEEFGLDAYRDESAENLPAGYRQRLAMATAMLHEPDILFLDEPTSGADPLARREFWLRINQFVQSGVTILVTTHFMEEAEYCDRMIIMSRGTELAQGRPDEIRSLARTEEHLEPTIEDAFITLASGKETTKGI